MRLYLLGFFHFFVSSSPHSSISISFCLSLSVFFSLSYVQFINHFFCEGYLHCLVFCFQFIELLLVILFESAFLTHFSRAPGHNSRNVKLTSGFLRLRNLETLNHREMVSILIMVWVLVQVYLIVSVGCHYEHSEKWVFYFSETYRNWNSYYNY